MHRFRNLLSPDGDVGTAGGIVTPPAVADAAASSTTQSTPPVAPSLDEAAAPSKRDWAQSKQDQREIKAKLEQMTQLLASLKGGNAPAPEKAKDSSAPVDTGSTNVLAELAFRDAMDEHGITDVTHKKALRRLFSAERPPDVGSWLLDAVETLGITRKAAAVTEAPKPAAVPPIASSNTGAPVGGTKTELSANPWEWPKEVVDKMSPAEVHAAVEAHRRQSGGFTNPFLAGRRDHNAAPDFTASLAAQIAKEMKR